MLTPASASFRKAFAPAPATFSMRIVRADRSLYSISAPSSASLAPLSSSAMNAIVPVSPCRSTYDDVHATSSHGLTGKGELTSPVVELDRERTRPPHGHDRKWLPVEATPRDVVRASWRQDHYQAGRRVRALAGHAWGVYTDSRDAQPRRQRPRCHRRLRSHVRTPAHAPPRF